MKNKNINCLLQNLNLQNYPIMLYDLKQLKENINKVLYMREKYNIEFLFPIKAFPNQKVLNLFNNFNFGFDIANDNEYNLIKLFINKNSLISVTGLSEISKKQNCKNIIYNLNDISNIKNISFYNGLRINPYFKVKNEFSRFGITLEDIDKINLSQIISLSFHFYNENENNKINIIKNNYKKVYSKTLNLKYFNIGGNWDILNINNFEKNIIKLRKDIPFKIKLLVEVGENWFKNCGYLITKVIGINEIKNKQVIYIDACKESVAKWSVLKPINLNKEINKKKISIISGSSCYEKDIFSVLKNKIDIAVNDQIIFAGLNGYSYAWCKEFNGLNKPEVVFYE